MEPRARLPDLTAAEKATVRRGKGSADQLIVELGSGQQQVTHFLGDSWLTEAGVSAEQISALAGKFRISDQELFRAVIAITAHDSKVSKDYRILPGEGSRLAAEERDYDLLREIDKRSRQLEQAHRKLRARAEEKDREAAAFLARHLTTQGLVQALREHRAFIHGLLVLDLRRPAQPPGRPEARRLVVDLARAWTRLTGQTLRCWSKPFGEFVEDVRQLVGIETRIGKSTLAGWVKEELRERENLSNSARNDE